MSALILKVCKDPEEGTKTGRNGKAFPCVCICTRILHPANERAHIIYGQILDRGIHF